MSYYQFTDEEFACLEGLRVPLAVYQFIDRRVVVRVLSAGFCDLFDFESREDAYAVMTNDMYSTAHPDDAARIANTAFRFATEEGEYEVVYRIRTRKSSVYKLIHAIGEHVYKPTGERLAYVWYTDEGRYSGEDDPQKTALRETFNSVMHKESLILASYYDDLTGLPNMSYFLELVENGRKKLRESGQTPAVLFIDLNGMKHFNRKFGFAEGNKLLREVSGILTRHFKSDDCSRFGQDHFAVLTCAEGLEDKLKLLLAECAQINDGQNLPIRIGVYVEGQEHVDASTACDRAKFACDSLSGGYASGYTWYNEGMLADMENRQYIIDNLDRAISEKWIKVYYQPIIRTANGRVCDEEALSRWIDPVTGFLSPAEFIPALEDAKLIYKLDLYVVDCILEKIKAHAAEGLYSVPQSVNLSRSDFDACDIVEEIRRRVDDAGIERSKLTIEITESVVGSDFEFMKAQIERFQALGFDVWMDDFGSGYSSLDVLQSIHFDLIKFDMSFMRRFNESDETKIILTELIRMAIGLETETICEGVEAQEQVDFLREVGCTKIQGFYYCKPIPPEEIIERNRKGIQIGFENPDESDYYAAIGQINLYDASVVAQGNEENLRNYFNTIPMAIIETTSDDFTLVRCNNTYRSFMMRVFGVIVIGSKLSYADAYARSTSGKGFLRSIRQCGLEGKTVIVDEMLTDGATIHALVKRVAVNPVTGTSALAVAVLAIMDKASRDASVNYVQIANALSSDYFDLFYIDLDTEDYSQYSSNSSSQDISAEKHGQNFFDMALKDARTLLYEDDYDYFCRVFTKDNLIHALNTQGSFTLTYRQMINGEPVYVNMKAVRMQNDRRHIIIGVNNVNAQMREKLALEQMEEERTTYARIAALSGNFICIYTIDPRTDHYFEYSSTHEYEQFGVAKSGEDFFHQSREVGKIVAYSEDLEMFLTMFTKENILREIRRNGVFELQYRLVINDSPRYVSLRAAMVQEKNGPQIILGISDIDARVRRDMEYAHNLSVARSRANIDPLTGVKNREAYFEAEAQLNAQLEVDRHLEFAIALFDVSGLDAINKAQGHRAGDTYLKRACAMVCSMFKHSPVYRIEDDSFAAIVRGKDYDALDSHLEQLARSNEINLVTDGMVVSFGAARYNGSGLAGDVFQLANSRLQKNKHYHGDDQKPDEGGEMAL